jgi:transposase-like protein
MDSDSSSGSVMLAPATLEAGLKPGAGASAQNRGRSKLGEGDADDLPPKGTTRWVIRRKAQVVAAVESGKITLDDVCERYEVSVEEFEAWRDALRRHGVYGLRSTRSQIYRSDSARRKEPKAP